MSKPKAKEDVNIHDIRADLKDKHDDAFLCLRITVVGLSDLLMDALEDVKHGTPPFDYLRRVVAMVGNKIPPQIDRLEQSVRDYRESLRL